MSFQGDVGGIGLADLLQSLARGRDGVLSLISKGGLRSTVGIQDGQLHLLPEPDEDGEIWRARVRQAWVKDPDYRIDALRMTDVARAHRTETLYRLLDSEGVHFRFTPGPIPEKPSGPAISAAEPGTEPRSTRRDGVFLGGMSVEGFLLEYARIKDELGSANVNWPGFEDAVLVPVEGATPPKDATKFFEQCDGASNLCEISDRLGWPLRQTLIAAWNEIQRGSVRLAGADELLAMAQTEIGADLPDRGASRLRGWAPIAPCGPFHEYDAQSLQTEWDAGRLQNALRLVPPRVARTFLRRLDTAIGAPLVALDHWTEVARTRPEDRIAQVRLVHLQTIASADPNVPAVRDLLAMARGFLDAERRIAAASILRLAADRAPESTSVRLEIGMGFLACGSPREAGPWIVDACASLLENNDPERALEPLKQLVDVEPGHREARRLLSRARTRNVQRTLVKKNSLITMAVVLALSVGAVVQFRAQRALEARLDLVYSNMDDPGEALRVLQAEFGDDDSGRIAELRRTLVDKKRNQDLERRAAWTDAYRDAQSECTLGDPALGLRRALALPPPPTIDNDKDKLPLVSDLFNGLGARVETQINELGTVVEDTQAQQNAETRVRNLIAELKNELATTTTKIDSSELKKRLDALLARVNERDVLRSAERTAKEKRENLAKQDMLIGAARAHDAAGDYKRALELYADLLRADTTGKLESLLQKEIVQVGRKNDAVVEAATLSRAGRQAEAYQALRGALKREEADARLLPWRFESLPAGARVHLPDGTSRVTPFTVESTWNERFDVRVEFEGYEPLQIAIEHPADQSVLLSRVPERSWSRGGRVEALPIRVAEDHVVCDRSGHVERIGRDGRALWSHTLTTLGGFGRTPVFLSRLGARLLFVSEDGEVYLVDVREGALEGPFAAGVPPTSGPVASSDGARVRFRDGRVLEWTEALEPGTAADLGGGVARDALGQDLESPLPTLSVLRRLAGSATRLESPWTEFSVEVTATHFVVTKRGSAHPSFTVARAGEWSYVAWESPTATSPGGRLWVSDARGLRSFLP